MQRFYDNKQNRNNHKQHDIKIKNEAQQKELPSKKPSPIEQLEDQFNPSWTKELDKHCEGQDIKMLTLEARGHSLSRLVHNNNPFDAGDLTLISSPHTPYAHMFAEEFKITRILSNISCYSKSALKVKSHSNIKVPVKVDLPSHLVDNETNYEIKNFSYATYLNLIRPLNTDDIPDDGSTKYQLRYYTSYPDNFYIVDLKEPIMELDNQSNKDLNYKENSLIGKAYNIFTIYTNRLNVEEEYKNKYLTIKDKGIHEVEPSVRECLIKANVEEGTAAAGANCNIKVSVYNHNFNENLTTMNNSNDISGSVCDNDNYFQHNIKMTLDNITVHNDTTIPDDPLLSDFNPPDEYDLKDPSEWTKDSLKDSVHVGPCPDDILEKFVELLWQNKDAVSNSTTVAPSSLPEVHLIPK
ncbi:unnamed protein product, partial [Rotaria socialis]